MSERANVGAYLDFFDASTEAVYICDAKGQLVDVSPSFVALLGRESKEEVLLCKPQCQRVAARLVLAAEAQGQLRNHSFSLERTGGARLELAVDAVALHRPDGSISGYRGKIRSAQAGQDRQPDFGPSKKLEVMGRLATGVAHDFGNILIAIQGFAALALEDLDRASDSYSRVKEIEKASGRATALTQQLLSFARQQQSELTILSLNLVLSEMELLFRYAVGAAIEVELDLDSQVPLVEMDVSQLEQVLMSLTLNARDAMPEGGRLHISTSTLRLPEEHDDLDVPPGIYVCVTMTDTGFGMKEETVRKAFDPFFTTKARGRGTGMGLATSLAVARQAGGTIWIESEPGVGSALNVLLPASQDTGSLLEDDSGE